MKIKKIVVDSGNPPMPKMVLADHLAKLSAAAQDLRSSSGLNDRAIVLLLADSSRVNKSDVQAVLASMAQLRRDYGR